MICCVPKGAAIADNIAAPSPAGLYADLKHRKLGGRPASCACDVCSFQEIPEEFIMPGNFSRELFVSLSTANLKAVYSRSCPDAAPI